MSTARSILDNVSRVRCAVHPLHIQEIISAPANAGCNTLENAHESSYMCAEILVLGEPVIRSLAIASSDRARDTCHGSYLDGMVKLIVFVVRFVQHSLYLHSPRDQLAIGYPA